MKQIIILFLVLSLQSCYQPSEIQKDFSCNDKISFNDAILMQDFQKKFELMVPKKWATKLFYNDYQTSLMTADSLKPLTKSFILDVSLNNGELKVDDKIKNTVIRNIITKEHLRINKLKVGKFHNKPSLWLLAEGTRNNLPFHLFKLLSKNDQTTYYQIEAQIYGDSLVNNRVCKVISMLETLKEITKK